MTEQDMGCSDFQLEDIIDEMGLLNDQLDIVFEKVNSLVRNIGDTEEWKNMGKPEMESYLSLLSQYQMALSGTPGTNTTPTKQMVTELAAYAGKLGEFKVAFRY